MEYTLEQFNKSYPDIEFFVLSTQNDTNNGSKIVDDTGKNIKIVTYDDIPFNIDTKNGILKSDIITWIRKPLFNKDSVIKVDGNNIIVDNLNLSYKLLIWNNNFLCEHILKNNPLALKYVDIQLSEETLKYVVSKEGLMLMYIHETMQTSEICLSAILNTPWSLQYASPKFQTYELCKIALTKNGYVLDNIGENLTQELCNIAIETTPLALKFVPARFQNEELCYNAVKNDGYCIRYVEKELLTEKICKIAIVNNASAIGYIQKTKDEIVSELCKFAIDCHNDAIYFMTYLTNDIYEYAMSKGYNINKQILTIEYKGNMVDNIADDIDNFVYFSDDVVAT